MRNQTKNGNKTTRRSGDHFGVRKKNNGTCISTNCEITPLETRNTRMHLILDGGSANDVDEVVVVGVRGPLGGGRNDHMVLIIFYPSLFGRCDVTR